MPEQLTYIEKPKEIQLSPDLSHKIGSNAVNGLIILPELIVSKNIERLDAGLVTTKQAADQLIDIQIDRPEYSLEDASLERPYLHYSRAGNIFQILRFGIQSNNFKNRFENFRDDNPDVEQIAQQMCGLRVIGASYQEEDSISLSKYSENKIRPLPNKIMFLINRDISVVGEDSNDRDATTGYGYGIKSKVIDGEYKVGNKMAYSDEVLGVNIILPKDLRVMIVGNYTSILSDMSNITRESEKYLKKPRAVEDITANPTLLAELTGSDDLIVEINELKNNMKSMDYNEVSSELFSIQKRALSRFVGIGNKLNEENLRRAIEDRFNIKFIEKY